MQHLRAALFTLATLLMVFIVAEPAMAQESQFVLVPRADSPGNDYTRIDHFSFEDCQRSCAGDTSCNAFTYNQLNGVCFLKSAANQWVQFYAWAITGIKLSPPCEGE